MFTCEKRSMTLSKAGCSRLYVSANGPKRPEPWEGRSACISCPIGAFNATGTVQNPIMILSEAIRMLCPRCGRLAQGLINGSLCRCCHARHLEALKKLNSKKKEPALSAQLHTQRIAISAGSATRIVTQRSVIGLPEVILHQSKAAAGPLAFGRRALQWRGVPQMEMAL